MKISLLGARPVETGTYGGHGLYETLGIRSIAAYLQSYGYNINIIEDSAENLEKKVDEVDADIIGLSFLTLHWPKIEKIAKKIKGKTNASIVAGGYHASAVPYEVIKNPNIDYLVKGEGEITFKELTDVINSGNLNNLKNVDGIFYKKDGKIIENKPRKRIIDLDSLPEPIRDKEIIQKSKDTCLTYPPTSEQIIMTINYSRGCYHRCTFCSSPSLWGNEVIWRSPDNVVNEIKKNVDKYNINYVYFLDLTFNSNKEKIISLCDKLKKININWWAMPSINEDIDIIKNMAEAGCTKLGIGAESLNYDFRKKIGKAKWKNDEKFFSAVWHNGIISRAFLMVGYPWETKESLGYLSKRLKELYIDDIKLAFFTPFPGTKSYEQFKDLLITDDLSKFESVYNAVLKPYSLTIEQLYEYREKIYRDFFQSKEYEQRMKEKIRRWPKFKKSYEERFKILEEKGVF